MIQRVADEHLRTEDDVEAILRMAVQQSGTSTQDLRTRLLATAEELGLTEEQVLAAEEAYRRQKAGEVERESEEQEHQRLWKEFRRSKRGDLVSHLGTYVAVNAFLIWMDLFIAPGIQWAWWVVASWGLAIVIHLFTFLAGETSESLAEFDKWKRKRKGEKIV